MGRQHWVKHYQASLTQLWRGLRPWQDTERLNRELGRSAVCFYPERNPKQAEEAREGLQTPAEVGQEHSTQSFACNGFSTGKVLALVSKVKRKQVLYPEMDNITATKLDLITKRSKHKPQEKFTSLAHLMNVPYLIDCFEKLNERKAAGVDDRTKEDYTEQEIKQAITDTVQRMKAKKYKPKPVKRLYFKKPNGKLRPIGIPAVIDKAVQLGLKRIMEAIWEPHFQSNSYGFRPNKNCHGALKAVHRMIMTKPVNWIIDADIKSFFDNVDHQWMINFINHRIKDRNFRNIVIKHLQAGVMEQGKYYDTEKGTPQGGVLSPLLANIYLHYALDLWFNKKETKNIDGYAELIRYADDFIIGVQTKQQAQQILKDLKQRLAKFGLELSEEKTRLIEFGKYAQENASNRGKQKPETFDFLGFTHYCSKSRKGNFLMKVKTSRKKQNRKLKALNQWLRAIRNKVKREDIWQTLALKLQGHFNYYGISSNFRSIQNYYYHTLQLTFKWLNRRSQKASFNWEEFNQYIKRHPLPKPALVFNMYDLW